VEPAHAGSLLACLRQVPDPRGAHGRRHSLEAALRGWIAEHAQITDQELSSLAIDGKTLCSTLAQHGRSIQRLSLFDSHTGCVLSQMQVPVDTNEAKAALPILKSLVLQGRVVTGDAIYTTPEICRAIVDSGGDYLLVVKDSNRETKEAIADEFLPAFSPRYSA